MRLRVALLLACALACVVAYEAPPWACSAPPKSLNPVCPGLARGDSRCDSKGCAPDAGCAKQECNAVQGSIDGTTVVLDAWLSIRGSSCKKTQWTVSECCALCQDSPTCNAWSYCNNPAGCGSGCVASLHEHKSSETPLYTISPVSYTRRLNPEHKCTPSGGWAYQTCTLKFVEGVAKPSAPPLLRDSKANAGWVSGLISKAVSQEVQVAASSPGETKQAAAQQEPAAQPEQPQQQHKHSQTHEPEQDRENGREQEWEWQTERERRLELQGQLQRYSEDREHPLPREPRYRHRHAAEAEAMPAGERMQLDDEEHRQHHRRQPLPSAPYQDTRIRYLGPGRQEEPATGTRAIKQHADTEQRWPQTAADHHPEPGLIHGAPRDIAPTAEAPARRDRERPTLNQAARHAHEPRPMASAEHPTEFPHPPQVQTAPAAAEPLLPLAHRRQDLPVTAAQPPQTAQDSSNPSPLQGQHKPAEAPKSLEPAGKVPTAAAAVAAPAAAVGAAKPDAGKDARAANTTMAATPLLKGAKRDQAPAQELPAAEVKQPAQTGAPARAAAGSAAQHTIKDTAADQRAAAKVTQPQAQQTQPKTQPQSQPQPQTQPQPQAQPQAQAKTQAQPASKAVNQPQPATAPLKNTQQSSAVPAKAHADRETSAQPQAARTVSPTAAAVQAPAQHKQQPQPQQQEQKEQHKDAQKQQPVPASQPIQSEEKPKVAGPMPTAAPVAQMPAAAPQQSPQDAAAAAAAAAAPTRPQAAAAPTQSQESVKAAGDAVVARLSAVVAEQQHLEEQQLQQQQRHAPAGHGSGALDIMGPTARRRRPASGLTPQGVTTANNTQAQQVVPAFDSSKKHATVMVASQPAAAVSSTPAAGAAGGAGGAVGIASVQTRNPGMNGEGIIYATTADAGGRAALQPEIAPQAEGSGVGQTHMISYAAGSSSGLGTLVADGSAIEETDAANAAEADADAAGSSTAAAGARSAAGAAAGWMPGGEAVDKPPTLLPYTWPIAVETDQTRFVAPKKLIKNAVGNRSPSAAALWASVAAAALVALQLL